MSEAKKAAKVFQNHRKDLGFVNEAQCRQKTLYTIEEKEMKAAALVNHCKTKPQTTIYDIASIDKREGYGTRLFHRIKKDSPHDNIVAKCPVDLDANEFYKSLGFKKVRVEEGKNRELNVWKYTYSKNDIDLIMTISNRGDTAQAIMQSQTKIGIASDKEWRYDFPPYFLDFPFTNPDANFHSHIKAVKKLKPNLTVAPDIEKGRKLDDVIRMGNRLLELTDDVILVPKSCHPSNIPDRFRVGLALNNFGSGSPYGVWDYKKCKSVHILGGTPNQQLSVISTLDNVDSVDSYTLGMRSKYGMWDDGAVDAPDRMDYKQRLKSSLRNYHRVLNEVEV